MLIHNSHKAPHAGELRLDSGLIKGYVNGDRHPDFVIAIDNVDVRDLVNGDFFF